MSSHASRSTRPNAIAFGMALAWILFGSQMAFAETDDVGPINAETNIIEPGITLQEEQEQVADAEAQPRAELAVEPTLPARPLTLDEALALSVQHNLNVEVARYEPQISLQDAEGAWGAYDPVLSADVGYDQIENRNTFALNTVVKNQERNIDGGAAINTLLPYIGASLGVEWDTGRTRTNSDIQALVPQYDSAIFLTANIPLLRGLIWNEAWTQVKVRDLGYNTTLDRFREAVMDITESTINAYWTLVADREQVGVARKSLETALALLDQTQTQYEVGVVSKVDVVEAEAGVADREFNLIVARNRFENSEDNLVDAVLGRELKATMTFRLQPADDPEDYTIREVDVDRAVATAMTKLPELAAAERDIEQREIELKFAKNARLPRFDIDARYGFVNTSGDGNAGVCTRFDPVDEAAERADCFATVANTQSGYVSSYDDMYSADGFENYSVRGVFSIPIPNTTARHNVTKSEIQLRRSKTQKVRTTQQVILDVRSAARGVLASARGIDAAERRRLAAAEQLRAERIRLEHGESTPFDVLLRESDLVDAESQKIVALQSYRAAEARLERAQGTILEKYRIEVEGVLDEPNL